jgi:lysophospholipase L1-like esterase
MNLVEARYEMLKAATRRPCVVMVGDSLTAGVPWSEVAPCPGVANYGFNGDTSAGVLYRIHEVILLKPRAVFLMVGANDLLKGIALSEIAGNIRTLVGKLEAEGIEVVVHPVVPFVDADSQIDDLNDAIVSALADTKSKIVPLPIELSDLRDGLHLGPTAFTKWNSVIEPLLVRYCSGHST